MNLVPAQQVPLYFRSEATNEKFAFSDELLAAVWERPDDGVRVIGVRDLKEEIARRWRDIGCTNKIHAEDQVFLVGTPVVAGLGDDDELKDEPKVTLDDNVLNIPVRYFTAGSAAMDDVGFVIKVFEPFESREQLRDACYTALKSMLPQPADGGAMQALEEKHGPLRVWDVSAVADLSFLFCGTFGGRRVNVPGTSAAPLPALQVRFRTNWADQLYGPGSDEGPVDRGYPGCADFLENRFNPDLSGWNTSGVKKMDGMFCGCEAFAGVGVQHWDVSSVKSMRDMFGNCYVFDAPLAGWSTANVEDMSHMFAFTSMSHSLAWDCSSCRDMESMFESCQSFNLSTRFDFQNTGHVQRMTYMFEDVTVFAWTCILAWDISDLQNAACMFCKHRNAQYAGALILSASDQLRMKEKGWPEHAVRDRVGLQIVGG